MSITHRTATEETDVSVNLAAFWLSLKGCEAQINGELLPQAGYLQVEDQGLVEAMERLSAAIAGHFERFKIMVVARRADGYGAFLTKQSFCEEKR